MKRSLTPLPLARPIAGLFALCLALPAWSQSEDPRPPRPDGEGPRKTEGKGPGGPKRDGDPFKDLTPEQREALREAMRQAWNEPAVTEARTELKVAAERYQKVLQNAIERIAPELKEPIETMRNSSDSAFKGLTSNPMGGPRPQGGGPGGRNWRDYDSMVTMARPSFLEDLSPDLQKAYREGHAAAMENPRVVTALDALRELREQDESMRMKRYEAVRRAHQAIRAAISESYPELKEHFPERNRNGGGGGSGGRGGQGAPKGDRPNPTPPSGDRPPLED